MHSNSRNSDLNKYRLGLWYGTYRLIIALCLFFVFFLTYSNLQHGYGHPLLYLSAVSIYIVSSLIQLIFYKFFVSNITKQVTLFFAVDILFFSALTLATDGPSLHISLLFVIAIRDCYFCSFFAFRIKKSAVYYACCRYYRGVSAIFRWRFFISYPE